MEQEKNTAPAASRAELIRQRLAKLGNKYVLSDIAKEFGVTRQYVSAMHALMKRGVVRANNKRGRKRMREFTAAERRAFAKALALNPKWTPRQAKSWFSRQYGRSPTTRQLFGFAAERGVTFTIEQRKEEAEVFDEDFYRWQNSPAAKRIRELESKLARTADADVQKLTAGQVEIMENINAETLRQLRAPQRAPGKKIGRNDPCPHNPSLKFKRCCGANGGHYCTREQHR